MFHPPLLSSHSARPPVRALIFDMDGTILDTRAYHMAAWRRLVERLGLGPEAFEQAEAGFGKTNWAIFEQWYGDRGDRTTYDALSDEKETIFRDLIAGRQPARPGFRALLAWARRRGLRIALATSGPRANAEFILKDLGVESCFDAVVWGHANLRSKPHPEAFLDAAQRLGVAPPNCLGIEDSSYGCWSVVRAGMHLLAIAERPDDLAHIRKWTPFVLTDFLGAPQIIRTLQRNGRS